MIAEPGRRPRVVAGLRLLHLVGSGGEGEVWEARDRAGRRRALKLIRPGALVEPDEVQRRGRWLVHVQHPALCRVWRTGTLHGGGVDGWGFVEMDFVDGAPADRAPADPDVLDRLLPLAEALDLLHAGHWSEGVPLVHRDIKPANLIHSDGALVLVDHSTLRAVDGEAHTRIGTPVFVAPEVATGRSGPAADVYSFAATAVALVTGARGSKLAALLADAWALDLPEGISAALSEAPGERPRSCQEVLGGGATARLACGDTAALPEVPAEVWSGGPAVEPPDDPADTWTEVEEDIEQASSQPARAWPWLLVAGALSVPVVVGLTPEVAGRIDPAVWLVAAALAHLLAHRLAGESVLRAALLPPVGWGFLLADRAAVPGRLRDHGRALCTGAMLLLGAGLAAPLLGDAALSLELRAGLAAAGWVLAALAVTAMGERRGLRRGLLVVWLLGAVVLVLGALALLPFAVVAGRGAALLRLAGRTLAGVRALR